MFIDKKAEYSRDDQTNKRLLILWGKAVAPSPQATLFLWAPSGATRELADTRHHRHNQPEFLLAKKKVYSFEGKRSSVTWDSALCIHAEECIRANSPLFELDRKPWGQTDLVEDPELDDVIRRCPTGALAYQVKDGSSREEAQPENTVTISANGPAYIRGNLEFEGGEGEGATIFRAALCRCGHSRNKPFCDNSHLEANFRDSGAVGREGPGFEEEGGTLTITTKQNGSLQLRGNVSIRSASGTIRWRGSKVSLCRCGLSKSKPFCDGSHREGNFEADGFVKATLPKSEQ